MVDSMHVVIIINKVDSMHARAPYARVKIFTAHFWAAYAQGLKSYRLLFYVLGGSRSLRKKYDVDAGNIEIASATSQLTF